MYLHCKKCDGNKDKTCYATREEVIAHLEEFQRLRLDYDNGKLEESLSDNLKANWEKEELFVVHKGGFL